MLNQLNTESSFRPYSLESSSLLLEITRAEQRYFSSAVAISDDIVLTTAHSVDLMSSGVALANNIKIEIEKVVIHHSYDPAKSLYENDIALVFLSKKLPFDILPAIIAKEDYLSPGFFQRLGHGQRENLNLKSVFNIKYLNKSFDNKSINFLDTESVSGDSGGPIYKMTEKGLKLIAIHSTLEGEHKIIAVNLGYYVDWIQDNTALFFEV